MISHRLTPMIFRNANGVLQKLTTTTNQLSTRCGAVFLFDRPNGKINYEKISGLNLNLLAKHYATKADTPETPPESGLTEQTQVSRDVELPESDFTKEDLSQIKNWFEDRYKNFEFHERDGVDPKDWLLVYQADEKKLNYTIKLLGLFALGAFSFGITIMAKDFYTGEGNPFAFGPAFIFIGIMAVTYAIRMRRYAVVRLYSNREAQEVWEHWLLLERSKPESQKLKVFPPKRHYRLLWQDMKGQSHIVGYDSSETANVVERKSPLARSLYGNYFAKGRPWAVHPEFFYELQDYLHVRRR